MPLSDRDIVLDLQSLVAKTYDKGAYRDHIDYRQPCLPPLSAEDQAWANHLIQQAGS